MLPSCILYKLRMNLIHSETEEYPNFASVYNVYAKSALHELL